MIVEITRWKSIGDALAPIWTKRPFPGVNRYFYKRERPTYGPTTCLSAGAEGGVRILWNIPGDSSKSALLQWRPAPPTAAGSVPITVVVGGSLGVKAFDFTPSARYRKNSHCENRVPSAAY